MAQAATNPVSIIFDTDMGNDVDDALALAMLHAFESRGEAKLLAVTITKDNRWSAPYVDLVDHFYGRGEIPIGVVKQGKTPEDSNSTMLPALRKAADATLLWPRKIQDGRMAPNAVELLRELLERQPDGSVVMVQVGFSTNLARLVESPGGKELVARKVRLLSMMAGHFPTGNPEYNVKEDLDAAKALFRDWPTPIVTSGYEIGAAILYPARSIENDFGYVEAHPIVDAYRHYKPMPYDRQCWDLTAVLYAVRPDQNYFALSPPGWIRVDDQGRTQLEEDPAGRHRYLILRDGEADRVLEALIALVTQPPNSMMKK